MRDEDLKKLPQSIEPWKVREMLERLGIEDWTNVREMRVLPREVAVDVLATDESGHRYMVENDEGERVAAEHKISIPYVGEWEKPAAEEVASEQVEIPAISLWKSACHGVALYNGEELTGDANWEKDWQELLSDSEREMYRDQAREMLKWMGLG